MLNLAVLISGRGSNLQSIIDATVANKINAGIKIVISNLSDAYGLKRASKHNIPTKVISKKEFPDKESFDSELIKTLQDNKVDLVVLAGFMKIISPKVTAAFPLKIVNIHPSLLPEFPGLNVQKRAIDAGVKESGCTVHFVDDGVDTGPIILQRKVPVLEGDTEKSLSERILVEEHKIYPEAIGLIADDRVTVEGSAVIIKK